MLDLHSRKKNVIKYPSPDPVRFYRMVTVSGPKTACQITVGQLAIHMGLPTVTLWTVIGLLKVTVGQDPRRISIPNIQVCFAKVSLVSVEPTRMLANHRCREDEKSMYGLAEKSHKPDHPS